MILALICSDLNWETRIEKGGSKDYLFLPVMSLFFFFFDEQHPPVQDEH